MKEGIPLSRVRTQLYIPLYAVYDFKNKEYAYVFDERYVDVDDENGVANLNLFELKVKDESGESSESERDEITTQKQPTPVIDMNKDQFEIMEPKCS